MSSDTGPRKRFKDKKRKKGSIGDANITVNTPRDIPVMKLVLDETIHVQKEANFGGNTFSKLIFVAVLCLIGMILFFVLMEYNSFQDDGENQFMWLPKLLNISSYFNDDNVAETVYDEDDTEMRADQNFFWYLWEFLPFGQDGKSNPEIVDQNSFDEQDASERHNLDPAYDEVDLKYGSKDRENNQNEDENYSKMNEEDEDEDAGAENNDNEENEFDKYDDNNKMGRYYDRIQGIDDENDDENPKEDPDEDNENRNLSEDDDNDDKISRYRFTFGREKETRAFGHDKRYAEFEDDERNDQGTDDYDDKENAEDTDDSSKEEDYGNIEEDAGKMPENEGDDSNEEQEDAEEDEDQVKITENQVEDAVGEGKSNVVTKLGVGVALIFVAYVVIIRKWNNYVNRPAENENLILADDSIAKQFNVDIGLQSEKQNSDYIYEEGQYQEDNEMLHDYLDSSTASESDDSKEASMRWSTSGPDILAQEVGDSKSVTSDSDSNDSDVDQNSHFNQYVPDDYGKANITNTYDWQYREDLDDADEDFDNGRITEALEKYRKILRDHENCIRARYGIAKSLDVKAELRKSNELLTAVIEAYVNVLLSPDIPNALFKTVAERTINRMRFKGDYESTIGIQNLLIDRIPDDVTFRNDHVVTLLMLNRISEAKMKLENILLVWPNDGLAMAHYGFVLKLNGNLSESVHYLLKGIESNENGTQDGRFYFHLGDALQRLKRDEEAKQIYRKGVKKGLFLSEFQRSLYNVVRLTSKPWWTAEQTTYQSFFKKLEQNWKQIQDEGVSLLKDKHRVFAQESEQLRETGDWRQFELFSRGVRRSQCNKAPITCGLISDFPPAAGCRRGQAKFSLMEAGTHVWPHCGPTNCRLRAHLGLIVPANVTIRVASESRNWKEGEVMVFDDSFEHEIWHNGTSSRLILIVDVWHPELTQRERKILTAI